MFIEIKNRGEMDINALTLIGASTKRGDDTKIGYFGSGLKYSLAVLIRHGVMPSIFIGQKKVDIKVEKKDFRGKEFNQIFIEGQPTSLTTDMGVDWEPWFAIREIYCNALDEGKSTLNIVDEIKPEDGKTSIYVPHSEIFNKLLLNWDKYFNNKRNDILLSNNGFKAFHGGGDYIIYRRGVRCHFTKEKSLYHYDCPNIQINESRTLYHSCDDSWYTAEQVARFADALMIKNIYDNSENHVEDRFYWGNVFHEINATWLEVLGGRRIVIRDMAGHYTKEISDGNCIILKFSLADALKKRFPKDVHIVGKSDKYSNFMVVDISARHESYINTAKTFLKECGVDVCLPVKVCIFEDKNTMAQAVGEEILISVDCLEKGKREIVLAIYEEYLHIQYNLKDESRAMQNHLFHKIISLMEEKINVFL